MAPRTSSIVASATSRAAFEPSMRMSHTVSGRLRTPDAGRGRPRGARAGARPASPCSRGSRSRRCGSPRPPTPASPPARRPCAGRTRDRSRGSPGSVRRLRAGSVTIGLSFCRTVSGVVLQVDRVAVGLRHLAAVGARDALGTRVSSVCGSGKTVAVEVVEAAHDLARELDVRRLVLSHRHRVGLVDDDVGGLQQRDSRGSRRSRGPSPRGSAAAPCRSAPAPATAAARSSRAAGAAPRAAAPGSG